MRSTFTAAFIAAFALVPSVAVAEPAQAAADAQAEAMPGVEEMLGFVDKLFPPQPDPDPARLALARTTAQSIWSAGAYGRMMTGFLDRMVERVMQLKGSDFEALGGKAKGIAGVEAKHVSLRDQAKAKDPYFDQRMAAMREVLVEEVGKVSAVVDPRMREGLARATARRFDVQQLAEINRFFATPTGTAFAGQYMELWIDPDTIRSLMGSMPELMKLLPGMLEKFEAANARFPKPPKSDDKDEKR